MNKILTLTLGAALFLASCTKEKTEQIPLAQEANLTAAPAANFPETFESGTKTAYAAANVTLTSGSWNLSDALIGTSTSDRKNGSKSVRMVNTGTLQMNFDVTGGATSVSVKHAKYGSDGTSTWNLQASTNGGSAWSTVGSTITTSSTTLSTATFTVSYSSNVRFRIVKASGGSARINIDDFSIEQGSASAGQDDHLTLGNPSGAVTNTSYPDNYLMAKNQFKLSYNKTRATPNWVAWHLSTAWLGSAARCDCFTKDATLPSGWYQVATGDYTNSGFDRGHMCPSADRTLNSTDNAATFLMTNIIPQAPVNNQQTWAYLEDYCRTLANAGNELYIYSGVMGTGGTGSSGTKTTIASGKITVPAYVWKVIVVLPNGTSDVSRVSTSTRVIAVKLPNTQTVNSQPWGYYRVKVDDLESQLGYDFLSNVSTSIQSSIESVVDSGPTN